MNTIHACVLTAVALTCAVLAADDAGVTAAAIAADGAVVDTVLIGKTRRPVNELTRTDIMRMSYDDLINLPFEVLVELADKLEISVDELLKMKMTVSSKAQLPIRRQPNIVSVVTSEDIRKSGARDLVDILRLVPGMFFGLDVNGTAGIGVRGLWAHEGKVLVLMDGQEMNDLDYYIFPYGGHVCPEQIERVEIIRGPGSSLYGGAAELGVINIITKQGADLNGVEVSALTGRTEDMFGRIARETRDGSDLNAWDIGRGQLYGGIGHQGDDFEFSLTGAFGTSMRSDKAFRSFYIADGEYDRVMVDELSETGHGELPMGNANVGVRWQDFSVRFIYDYYQTWGIDSWVYDNAYKHYLGELKYDLRLLGGDLTLTPKYNFRKMQSWWSVLSTSQRDYLRSTASLHALWDPTDWLNISGGVEYYHDFYDYSLKAEGLLDYNYLPLDSTGVLIEDELEMLDNSFPNGESEMTFDNWSVYAQALIKRQYLNLTVGGRFEYHSEFGAAFAPRVGLTGIYGNFHGKLLFSKAFRTPTVGAMALMLTEDDELVPEATYVTEMELGYQFGKYLFLTANLFDITIVDPIYYFDLGDEWGYVNSDISTGSSGFEIECALRHRRASATLNYSFYTNAFHKVPGLDYEYDDGTVVSATPFTVPGVSNVYIAAPQHKVSLMSFINIWKGFTVAPSFTWVSTTHGYTDYLLDSSFYADVDTVSGDTLSSYWEPYTQQLSGTVPPCLTANLVLTYDFAKGISVSAGVYDLFNQRYPLLQAYDGKGAPILGSGREWVLKVRYAFKSKK